MSRKYRVPKRMNPKRAMPGHIIIKLPKVKKRISKAAREEQTVIYKGNIYKYTKQILTDLKGDLKQDNNSRKF